MACIWKLRDRSFGKLVYSILMEKPLLAYRGASYPTIGRYFEGNGCLLYVARLMYSTKAAFSKTAPRARNTCLAEAQIALLDYLHNTRGLSYIDAEHISKNSKNFLEMLLEKVDHKQEVGRSVTKFLRYHPINEFEPFFESLGLKPSEFTQFLPSELMFLCDDEIMLHNYHAFCDYGIPHSNIGKIFKEVGEIFRYDSGILTSRLLSFESLGLSKSGIIKLASSCPPVLTCNIVKEDFVKVLKKLNGLKLDVSRFIEYLTEKDSYDWKKVFGAFCTLEKLGLSDEELQEIILLHPDLLLDDCGHSGLSLVALYLKLGVEINQMKQAFLKLPQMKVRTFTRNLQQGLTFLLKIEMETKDIGNFIQSNPVLLGSYPLKKAKTVLTALSVGKRRLRDILKDNPDQLKNWFLRAKLSRLPTVTGEPISLQQKTKFLVGLGFSENCDEMKKALKAFRGHGSKLQERFDCLVEAGLDHKDVSRMTKVAPHILNMKRELLEEKINLLQNDIGYPLQALTTFPSFVSFSIPRIKLRYAMYCWLKDKGKVRADLALSSIVSTTENEFVEMFVRHHPEGPRIWDLYKKVSCQIKK